MIARLTNRLSYANVMATGAMFVALGGGAYALSGVPDRSGVFHACASNKTGAVRVVARASSCHRARGRGRRRDPGESAISWNQQGRAGRDGGALSNGAITSAKLANGAVTSGKLANGAVTSGKLANGAVTSAKLGAGAVGAGKLGNVVVRKLTIPLPHSSQPGGEATCRSGERLLSGGVQLQGLSGSAITVLDSYPSAGGGALPNDGQAPTGWWGQAVNVTASTDTTMSVLAVCLT